MSAASSSSPRIHPTALVHPEARLAATVRVGPYAVIDAGVRLDAGCVVGPHVHLTGRTTIGPNNRFHAGCVIGDAPQDLRYTDAPTELWIGEGNVFREHVTVHRSNTVAEPTRIGRHGFFMAHCHVGHNCRVGDHVILANGVLLGGHVEVGDRVNLGGNAIVHQFVRIGPLAMMQGGAAISLDLAPGTVARKENRLAGLNTIGLRRAGLSQAERLELRRLYHVLFLGDRGPQAAVADAEAEARSEWGRQLVQFVAASQKGLVRPHRKKN